jgi:hypothetical protein
MRGSTQKGYGRVTTRCICKDCGTDNQVNVDDINGVFICQDCIEKEQNELDDQQRDEDHSRDAQDEAEYRKGVDNE